MNAVFLFPAFTERAAVEADDGGMTEIRVDAVEARRVGNRDIAIVRPGNRLRRS